MVAPRLVTVVRLWHTVPKRYLTSIDAVVPLSCDTQHRLQYVRVHNAIPVRAPSEVRTVIRTRLLSPKPLCARAETPSESSSEL